MVTKAMSKLALTIAAMESAWSRLPHEAALDDVYRTQTMVDAKTQFIALKNLAGEFGALDSAFNTVWFDALTAGYQLGKNHEQAIDWISVDVALPIHDPRPNKLGSDVLIDPPIDGSELAFYGTRACDTGSFYRYGAILLGVKRWRPDYKRKGTLEHPR